MQSTVAARAQHGPPSNSGDADTGDPLRELAKLAPRLVNVVEAISRRRDVRDVRGKLLLLLWKMRCPLGGAPAKGWYVPGAVARLGAGGILRAWTGYFGEEPPSLRSLRSHLGALQGGGALVRSPGDWMPVPRDHEHPERRPRYPDTLHLLEDDASAEWWAREGAHVLERNSAARSNPDLWKRLFRGFRAAAARLVREPFLPFDGSLSAPAAGPLHRSTRGRAEPTDAKRAAARALNSAALRSEGFFELCAALRELGADIRGTRVQVRLAGELERFRGAVRMLAGALARGDEIRNRAGWIVRAFDYAPELRRR